MFPINEHTTNARNRNLHSALRIFLVLAKESHPETRLRFVALVA